ncbi:MAG: histidinol dehydrogenase [bacterium]|nr:histidinol dehydrogenase [bacterium]
MINTVIPIVTDVKENGDSAVKKYTEKFDGVKLDHLLATPEEIEEGHANTPKEVLDAFMEAKKNVEEFHLRQQRDNVIYTRDDGTTLGMMYQAIESAAIYVPGGKASYPSSVLMGVIPAKIAGVKEITVITPPNKEGKVPNIILAICKELGVTKILKSGGAQGIAAAGLGTETVPRSDIIVGPGNIFVTAAKTYLFSLGIIQIDSMAGPSEVLIIADENANPRWTAFDLLSQAEHEEMAIGVMVTPSKELAEKVRDEIIKDIEAGGGRHEIKKASIEKSGLILVVDSLDEAIDFSNKYGPEHMQFLVENPLEYLHRVKNVGSLFLGSYAPVAVGDYFSGTNHVLPTGGAARFSSGTSVDTFTRRTTFQHLTKEALAKARKPVVTMSTLEGFGDKHGGSVDVRFEE